MSWMVLGTFQLPQIYTKIVKKCKILHNFFTRENVCTTYGTNVVHFLYQKRPPSRMNRKWPIRIIVLITKLLSYAI